MSDKLLQEYRKRLKIAILASMKKAPKGVRGSRGKLVHLQDPDFITTDAELLMIRPTRKLTPLINSVADQIGVNRPLVKKVVDELETQKILAVSAERKVKGVPKLIPIERLKASHTDKIGTFAHGQYAGFVFYLEPAQQRLVSVLHIFDRFGFHNKSNAWDSQTGCDPEAELVQGIGQLIQANPADIQVQLFTTEFYGETFGLVQTSPNHVEYVPYGLGFNPPWNGLYDT